MSRVTILSRINILIRVTKNGHPTKSDYLPVNTDYLDPEEVMCKVNDKYILRRCDLSTLKDGEWLNDKVS